jgi:hypothetical protein
MRIYRVIPRAAFACFFLIAALSCRNSGGIFLHSNTFDDTHLEIKQLTGIVMQFDDSIMHPVHIDLRDSLLLLKNRSTDYIYHLYSLKTSRKLNECFTLGEGPNDFLHPLIAPSADSSIWIYDAPKSLVRAYSATDLLSASHPVAQRDIKIPAKQAKGVAMLSSGRLLAATGFDLESRFACYDADGQLLHRFGDFPELASGELDPVEKFMTLQYDFATNLNDRIFVTYFYTDLIEVYDLEGRLLNRTQGPDHRKPLLKSVSTGSVASVRSAPGQTYKCYSAPVAAGDEVFALYFGELYETYEEMDSKIIAFDWNGVPLRIYELDIPIFAFAVDPETKTIYGISRSPEYCIVKYGYGE